MKPKKHIASLVLQISRSATGSFGLPFLPPVNDSDQPPPVNSSNTAIWHLSLTTFAATTRKPTYFDRCGLMPSCLDTAAGNLQLQLASFRRSIKADVSFYATA